MPGTSDLFDLSGKVALVTGASSGLGRQSALALVGAGAEVIGIARRTDALKELEKETTEKVKTIASDLTSQKLDSEFHDMVCHRFGPPDILVHAAGINLRQHADDVSYEGWDQTIAINLRIPFFVSKLFVPNMKELGWGRIINFASLQSQRAFASGIAYGAAKGGVVQLTKAMAEAWSSFGINVNAIGPGFFPTELTEVVFADQKRAKRNAQQTCIGRNGELADINGPIQFLASPASDYVTGQLLMVDGGFTAK